MERLLPQRWTASAGRASEKLILDPEKGDTEKCQRRGQGTVSRVAVSCARLWRDSLLSESWTNLSTGIARSSNSEAAPLKWDITITFTAVVLMSSRNGTHCRMSPTPPTTDR